MDTRSDGADRLLDEDQLGAVASKAVVLPHRDVGRLDLGQLAQHAKIARAVGVRARLGGVLVLGHHLEALGVGPPRDHLPLLVDRGLVLGRGRISVVRDHHRGPRAA